MGGVTFLPQELAGAQEQTCTHLPAHDVAPLVDNQWQVAIRMYPVFEGVPDDGLGCGTYDEFLLELGGWVNHHSVVSLVGLQTIVSNNGALLGEAFHMLGLAAEERLGDEQWEVGILHACFLETVVEQTLHLLPNGVAVWLDDHASTHVALFGQVGLHHQFVVPPRVILASLRKEV